MYILGSFASIFAIKNKNVLWKNHGARWGAMVFLLALINVQCSDTRTVRVIGKNFGEEVSTLQNLVFTFNQNLWPEGKLNEWVSDEYLSFEPAVRGQYKWVAPNELIFSPAAPLIPATNYRVHLNHKILSHKEEEVNWSLSSDLLTFHTPYLRLDHVRSWWTLSSESGRPEPRVRLEFNYPIDVSSVRERMKVMDGGKAIDFRLLPSESASALLIGLVNPGGTDKGKELQIEIAKGGRIEGAETASQEVIKATFDLPSSVDLAVSDFTSGFINNKGYITVYTSQELVPDQLSGFVDIQPKVALNVEPTEGGFTVNGDFLESETYVLKVGKGLKGVLGQSLKEEVSKDFFFGRMPESIQFVNKKAQYLSTKGNRNIGLQITNVPSLQVKISKVYDNNLLYYLYNRRFENYSEINGSWGPDGTYYYSDDTQGEYSDVLVNKKIQTDDLAKVNGVTALNISIPEVHGKLRKGVYLVQVASADALYLSAQKLVSVSDIGLIVKQGRDEVWVFANSIHNASPIKNVEISLISSNNQVMHTMVTDGTGVAHVAGLSEKAPGFRLAMVTASSEGDFNFLNVSDARVETSRFEVDGARTNPSGVQAYIYGERDVYRPGETLNFVSVVRSEDWKTLADFPVKLKLLTPNGQTYGSWFKNTNKQGAVEVSVKVEEASLTGLYNMELYNGNDVLLASSAVSVEEFVPDRIKVDLRGAKSAYKTGEQVRVEAVATNLFGPPASNRTFEMEFQLQRKQFFSKDYPDYTFEIPAEVSFERVRKQGVTDVNGLATGNFPISSGVQDIGLLDGKVYVTVFDENGRPVNRVQTFEVATQDVLYGIRMPDRYVGVNVPVQTDLISVDPSGKIRSAESAAIEVVKVSYQTVIEKRDGQLQYTSKRKDEVVYSQTLTLANGKGSFRYTPTVSGTYEVRIRRPGALHYSMLTYYAYGYGYTENTSFEVSSEGRVLIETDKDSYHPGERAKVLFKTPFDGKLLITIEQGEVLSHQLVETQNKAYELRLPVAVSYLPNVYVTATLMRPMDASQIPLTVAHGFAPLFVEAADRALPVKIIAPDASRSKKKQKIKIQTTPHAQLTIGVVDEGILQIKNFVTPNIYGYFYRKRALEVQAADLYAWLFPELDLGRKSSSGGDGLGLGRRINPLGNGNRELVRFWSGILEADGKGEVDYEVELPQFSGSLRIMAVAFKDRAFGSASKNMTITDPLVISAGVPRFLSPGDELTLPVTLTNTQKQTGSGSVSVTTEGALEKVAFTGQQVSIPAGSEERVLVPVKAANRIGKGKILIKASAFGEQFVQEYEVNVRPASPMLKVAQSGVIEGGESSQLSLNRGFMQGTSSAQLVVSNSPLVQGGGNALSTLLGYPHGCLEQTISRAFPQLYFADLARNMRSTAYFLNRGDSDLNPAFNVQQAIRKTESQQLFNGGFAMWPGTLRDDWWVSAYAVQFLDEARRAGFEVNPSVFQAAQAYLTTRTGRNESIEAGVANTDGSTAVAQQAPVEAIYSLYVLAATGKPNRSVMNYYKQHQELLTNQTKYLLAGAYHYIGDPASYRALLPTSYETDERQTAVGYMTPLSGLGLVLNMLIDTDPQNLQIPVLARQLSKSISSSSSLNTQEAVFGVLALGKLAKESANGDVTAEILAGGKKLAAFDGKKEVTITENLLSSPVSIQTKGKGKVYWFAETSGFEASGVYTEEDDGLKVRRYFLDRSGRSLSDFKQNDLVIVKITLASTRSIVVPNVVITDILPAGFEVENPRITSARDMPWIKNAAIPEYFDIRDDRIHYFVTASPTEKAYYYQLRVTSPGTFTVGPVAADAMYQTQVKSYSGGGKVRVR